MSPSLDPIRKANASRLSSHKQPLYAVFTGGTSGIGEYTLRAFAHQTSKGAGSYIYLVGRSAPAAETIRKDLAHLSNVKIHFIQANDLSLIKDVDRCSNEVSRLVHSDSSPQTPSQTPSQTPPQTPHIDFLIMTHADMWVGPRRETIEGLDKLFSLLSYSRIRFAQNFLPLLAATPLPSARVVSIFAGGVETIKKNFFPQDISLRNAKNFGYFVMRNHAILLKMIAFQELAKQHANISFVHVYPGTVVTPGYTRNPMPAWFHITFAVIGPMVKLTAVKSADVAEWMLGLTAAEFGRGAETEQRAASAREKVLGGGVYIAKYDGTLSDKTALYDELRRNGFYEKAWQHTLSAFKAIHEQGVFKE